jgi:hypothetical protein
MIGKHTESKTTCDEKQDIHKVVEWIVSTDAST